MEKSSAKMKTAVISIDVEEWFHLEYFDRSKCNESLSVLDGLDTFIGLTEKHAIKSTYFIVGELIDSVQDKLKKLHASGNDIALHSWSHKRPVSLSEEEFVQDMHRSLEEMKKIHSEKCGYRAPCFSLNRGYLNKIMNEGFLYDSSRINQEEHPLYTSLDISDFNPVVPNSIYDKAGFKEFEVSTVPFFGLSIPISGGGYLRIIPWPLYAYLFKKYIKNNNHYNLFIHPFELSSTKITTPEETSFLTNFRFNYNRKKVKRRLEKLILLLKKNGFEFKTFMELAK